MSEQDSYTKMAVADFTVKLVMGVIFGSIAFVAGIIFLIVTLVTGKNGEIIGVPIAFIVVGALVSVIDALILLHGKNKKKEPTKIEK